jgi:hypothetical protein
MADFRKWLLVLAVIVFAASASAQTTAVGCVANPGQTPILRDGGLAEIVGDVVLNCTPTGNGTDFSAVTANWQVFLNGPVTNGFTATSVPGLIVNENFAAAHVYQGVLAPGNTFSVLFAGVTIPAGTVATIRITNIRIAVPAASGVAGLPTPVQEIVTTSPVGIVPITTPVQIVGYVQPSFEFSVTSCTGGSGGTTSFQQCISQPRTAGDLHFGIKFKELFPTAFKPVLPPGGEVTLPSLLAVNNNSETGLFFTAADASYTREKATQGTRLIVKFTGIPDGVDIFVTDREIAGASASSTTITALNVPDADVNGAGGTMSASDGAQAKCGGVLQVGNGIVPPPADLVAVNVNADRSIMWAVWEVTASDPNLIESLVFGVEVSYTAQTSAGLPGLTTVPGAVNGTLAPLSTDVTASATAKRPRFNIPGVAGETPFAILPCVTNLLFPYVTNQLSYDTGMALVNTSLDNGTGSTTDPEPFDTQTQHGTCTLYFFGNMDVAPQTTADIPAGKLEKFTLGNPPAEFTADATKGFEGYIIARCNFQYAHGFAFIVDGNLPGFGSESYLALIIPDRGIAGRPVDPFSSAGSGSGEQLVH